MGPDQLVDQVTRFAGRAAGSTVAELCQALERLPETSSPTERLAAARQVAQPNARQAARSLLGAWVQSYADVTPANLAWALRAASAMDARHRSEQQFELVWTGPTAPGTSLRRSEQALLELIRQACSTLLLVTYVAYDVDAIVDALCSSTDRGVRVRLVVETPEASAGKLTLGATQALRRIVDAGAAVYHWPLAERPRDEGQHGLLHAKCCVADSRQALISSANLTGHALNLNMELGVLATDQGFAGQVEQHFERLIAAGTIRQLDVA